MLSKSTLRVINRIDKFPSEFQLHLYKQEMEISGLTEYSIKYYLETLLAFLNRKIDIIDHPIKFGQILVLKPAYYSLTSEKLSRETIRHYYKVLKHYSNFLIRSGLIERNVMLDITQPKKEMPLPTSLSEDQVNGLLEYSLREFNGEKRSKYLQMRGYILVNLFFILLT